ncbi:MAG: adenylosuccinate lyase [Bacteroidota bacterium]
MNSHPLMALSPLDGRYQKKLAPLSSYFSEFALIKYRILVEIEYLIALHASEVKPLAALDESSQKFLRNIYESFTLEQAQEVKSIEAVTNHDVKAVEYFIKQYIDASRLDPLIQNKEFIHFGLTSQDINNTASPMMLRDAIQEVYLPQIKGILNSLENYAEEWKRIPMLARTHGQAASPTTLGKEFKVFAQRLSIHIDELATLPYPAKFGGATGNLNAHYIAYPEKDWHQFAKDFVEEKLGLSRSFPTTQIEHYDGLGRIFDCLKRINSILIDLCQDVWLYISSEYFKQKVKAGEVGSSAMPHKVNPIDFENSEGNAGMSTALLEFLSRKLPVSRLQRDLTDSTIMRNVGVAIGYAFLSLQSLEKGLGKLLVNPSTIAADLDKNWAVLAEAIQTILRREAYPNPYEALKALTRGKEGIDAASLSTFVESLDVSEEVKAELRALRPENFIGEIGY